MSGRGPINCLLKEEVRRVRKKRRILQSVMLDRFKTVGFLTPLLQAGQGTGRDRDQTWRDKEADRDTESETRDS